MRANPKVQIFFAVLTALLILESGANADTSCKVSCSGNGSVQVDLESKCMCIEKDNCFLIQIGKNGPKMTTQGHGKIGEAHGGKFQTKSTSSTSYDNDAMDMGIPENTAVGKWIHKSVNCGPGGTNSTLGCIGVPCEHWPEIKKEMGKDLDVCGGGAPMSRNGGGGDSGGGSNKTGSK